MIYKFIILKKDSGTGAGLFEFYYINKKWHYINNLWLVKSKKLLTWLMCTEFGCYMCQSLCSEE